MSDTATFTVRVPADLKKRLDQLAEAVDRSRSWLTADALRSYVEEQQWQLAEIEEGLRDAEAGRVVPHDEVERWLKSWGKKPNIAVLFIPRAHPEQSEGSAARIFP
ncbi:MAG TPA: CopG family ribbon-helix-helix protein [Terriglobia bacterium]|nr:CopG family ribbon-helix-helix protein [Terriglobia bacterium]